MVGRLSSMCTIYDPQEMEGHGFVYQGVGRGTSQ
jgi:hypothetical protein